jgi:hypothetical protein
VIASKRLLGFVAVLTLAVAALVWTIVRNVGSEPYTVDRAALASWSIVTGNAGDPWVVAAQPSEALATSLLRQAQAKGVITEAGDARIVLPLILRQEYEDGLQGVHSVDALVRVARDAGLEGETFTPVCVGHKRHEGAAPLLFIALDSNRFRLFRNDAIPAFPEHAGTGVYDAGAITPILVVGQDAAAIHWWPLQIDQAKDCEARIELN